MLMITWHVGDYRLGKSSFLDTHILQSNPRNTSSYIDLSREIKLSAWWSLSGFGYSMASGKVSLWAAANILPINIVYSSIAEAMHAC